MKFAEVAVNVPVNQTFTYHIPDDLLKSIVPGHLVRVAFGTAMQPGIIVNLREHTQVQETKPILERLDPIPVVQKRDIDLARWISQTYLSPLSQCLWLMLPPGMVGKRDQLVHLLVSDATSEDPLQAKVIDFLRRRGSLRGEQLQLSLKSKAWKHAVNTLERLGVVKCEGILAPPKVRPLIIDLVSLAIHPDRIRDVRRYLGKPSRLSSLLETIVVLIDEKGELPSVGDVLDLPNIGQASLNRLIQSGAAKIIDGSLVSPTEDLDAALFRLRKGETDLHVLEVLARDDKPVDVSWVYAQTGATRDNVKRLVEREMIKTSARQHHRDSLAERDYVPMSAPPLTQGQRDVWTNIRDALVDQSRDSSRVFLLHGVTGSGKTEIYLRTIEHVLSQGRQAIFLVPEIALTAQTVRRVLARFPGKVAVVGEEGDEPDSSARTALVHGRLSSGERYDTWQRARAGEIDVVVGTRSALFTPLPDLGLVILDEEHDQSYKQSPPTLRSQVYYQTRDVAERMMRANGGTLILGSATPSIESFFRAQRGEISYLHLPERIMGHRVRIAEQAARAGVQSNYAPDSGNALTTPLPPVKVVDMRDELKKGNTGIFSRALQDALKETLAHQEQAILFLNRRGNSTYVFCRDCGFVVKCPRCDLPVTYHTFSTMLHCHHCNNRMQAPEACPDCGSRRIRYFGAGTQQVEDAIKSLFPSAIGLRWDADTTVRPDSHDVILQRFANRQANVLIGTQMIAKGLDLPLVTLVGVVSADVGLNLPDFRAGERTFQSLTQVAGRAGRGLLGGRVILQTYQPDHYAIVAAANHDYMSFVEDELASRRRAGYPPFRNLVRVLFRFKRESQAKSEAERAATLLRERINQIEMTNTEVIGPIPCFFTRLNHVYRWHILLRGPEPASVFRAHPHLGLNALDLPRGWHVDVNPVDVL